MPTPDQDEFFIGYAPPMPPALSRFVRRLVTGMACLFVWATALAAGHLPLTGGSFEFGHSQSFTGTVIERPYPGLRLDGGREHQEVSALLVAPGKHGADTLVRGRQGRHVTLTGTRIQRGAHTMFEVEPESVTTLGGSLESAAAASSSALAGATSDPVTLTGEIVDSKCFLGVMVPGSGKTHKECASLCLRGGIPAGFHVQDRSGRSSLLLLTGPDGEPIGAPAVQSAGEATSVTGSIHRQGEWLALRTDPVRWQSSRR